MMASITTLLMRRQILFFTAVCAIICILAWYRLPVRAIETNRTTSRTIALADLGFSSAESTVTTYYWAATQGELQRMSDCFAPKINLGLDESSFDIDMKAHVRKLWRGAEGLQILQIVDRGNGRVQADALLAGERWGDEPDKLILERTENEWRIVDIRHYSPKAGGLGEV